MKKINREEILKLFEDIQHAFPQLTMTVDLHHPHVDLNLDILQQEGLRFDMNLNLQGDELHLTAGHFWLEWFPCDNQEIREDFREAVQGLLSGEYRVLESYRGRRAVKAQLQRPDGQTWKTIGTWTTLSSLLPIPWQVTTSELRNTSR